MPRHSKRETELASVSVQDTRTRMSHEVALRQPISWSGRFLMEAFEDARLQNRLEFSKNWSGLAVWQACPWAIQGGVFACAVSFSCKLP
mmetsp:Transcript_147203/g.274184  ORF Transcript_147203/g.274184 Transcript_147203/m.274184 type:complete len:89 (-) Transcript_147203:437-703(-)